MTRERIVFMGTPDFAVPCLQALVRGPDDVVAVVTNPDRPAGRGKTPTLPPVKRAAQEAGVPVYQPSSAKTDEFAVWLKAQKPDRCIVVAYGQILPQQVLDIPQRGCINVHASVLPALRGAAPINWAIVRGHPQTGVSIMQMEAGLDSGPVYRCSSLEIAVNETAGELHDRLMTQGASTLMETLEAIHTDGLAPTPQEHQASTYAPMMKKADGDIDWSVSAQEIVHRIHGFNPWPGAWSTVEAAHLPRLHSQRIKLHRASVASQAIAPGLCRVLGDRLFVGTGNGSVEVLTLQAPGKRRVQSADFVRGVAFDGANLTRVSLP